MPTSKDSYTPIDINAIVGAIRQADPTTRLILAANILPVGSDGVSAQSKAEMLRLGVHPSQDAAGIKKATVTTKEPKYKDTGASQAEEFRNRFGDEASEEKLKKQQQLRDELMRRHQQRQEWLRNGQSTGPAQQLLQHLVLTLLNNTQA